MNKQEKKQAEELANAGGVELSDDDTAKASGGAILEDYVPNADAYIRCPSCSNVNVRHIESDWTTCTYKCNECKKKFTFNTETREYNLIKSGGCS